MTRLRFNGDAPRRFARLATPVAAGFIAAGRVAGDSMATLRFKAILPDGVKTREHRCTGLDRLSITPTSKAIERQLAARKGASCGGCSCG